jgi:phenylalanyl-tRNA synthetase alpha chain
MKSALHSLRDEALRALESCADESGLDAVRVEYLGRKGKLTDVLRGMRDVTPDERPAVGALANEVKDAVEARIAEVRGALHSRERAKQLASERVDVTMPGRRIPCGHVHPLTQVTDELVGVFTSLGFSVADGPEIEDDYHNFEALNFPPDHPARDMQDTFFLPSGMLLRTHTSPVQIRVMETTPPPLRVIVPGVVYRVDSQTARSSPMFHQIEGFMVDKRVSFADLKGVLALALRRIFGPDTEIRLRPSFFPFTEPSAEVDIRCFRCRVGAPGCRVCKGTGWLEILGSGMIDPNVFRFVGYDPETVSGFAFGMGIERIAMLKFQIDNIRLLNDGDLRFLRQF